MAMHLITSTSLSFRVVHIVFQMLTSNSKVNLCQLLSIGINFIKSIQVDVGSNSQLFDDYVLSCLSPLAVPYFLAN